VHARQVLSDPQIGFVPVHAAAISGVHWTQVIACVSHTPVGAAQKLLSVQTTASAQLLSGFFPRQ
jgi:hypothetical protein